MAVEYLIITLIVCIIQVIACIVFGIKAKKENKKKQERRERFTKAVSENVDKLSIKLMD